MELVEKRVETPRPLREAMDKAVPEDVEAYAVCDDEMDEAIVYFYYRKAA